MTSQRRRHSLLYDLYVGSSLWRLRRFLWWVRSDRRCERCGRPVVLHARRGDVARSVTVHHLTYARLGRERRSDVALICWPCHYAVQRGAPLRIPRSRQPWA